MRSLIEWLPIWERLWPLWLPWIQGLYFVCAPSCVLAFSRARVFLLQQTRCIESCCWLDLLVRFQKLWHFFVFLIFLVFLEDQEYQDYKQIFKLFVEFVYTSPNMHGFPGILGIPGLVLELRQVQCHGLTSNWKTKPVIPAILGIHYLLQFYCHIC